MFIFIAANETTLQSTLTHVSLFILFLVESINLGR